MVTVPAILLGVGLLFGGAAAVDVWSAIATGTDNLEALRWPIAYGVLTVYPPWRLSDAVNAARGLITIANTEQSFNGAVGDQNIAGDSGAQAPYGPSISPWQLLHSTMDAQGWHAGLSGADYAAIDTSSFLGLCSAARAAAVLWKSNEDTGAEGADLFKLWNGGQKALTSGASDTYASNATTFESSQGWA